MTTAFLFFNPRRIALIFALVERTNLVLDSFPSVLFGCSLLVFRSPYFCRFFRIFDNSVKFVNSESLNGMQLLRAKPKFFLQTLDFEFSTAFFLWMILFECESRSDFGFPNLEKESSVFSTYPFLEICRLFLFFFTSNTKAFETKF